MGIEDLAAINAQMENIPVEDRIRIVWALSSLYKHKHDRYQTSMLLFNSGGEQFAVLPHLTRNALPDVKIPHVFIDTGYYPKDTYQAEQWLINQGYPIETFIADMTPAMIEAIHGERFWEEGDEEFKMFQRLVKHEPMRKAVHFHKPVLMMGGRMREQTAMRESMGIIEKRGNVYNFNPLADWTKDRVDAYIQEHHLPRNLLHEDITKSDKHKECLMWHI